MCLTAYEFSVILFDLCLFITIFIFILNFYFGPRSVHDNQDCFLSKGSKGRGSGLKFQIVMGEFFSCITRFF